MTESFPLHWPEGRPRTAPDQRKASRFDQSHDSAASFTMSEVVRLGGKHTVLSTDAELRRDGRPYANQKVEDTGAAVYFLLDDKQMAFACDRWDRLADNIHAIGKTIEALRGIARWGTGDMLRAAFSGFTALPAPQSWRDILGVSAGATLAEAERAYRDLAKKHHPDNGGNTEKMAELNRSRDAARKELT